jgi:ribosome maturation factor RimP
MDRLERLRGIAERVAATHGLTIFDVQYRRESVGWVLRVFVDRSESDTGPSLAGTDAVAESDSVSIEDCRRVSLDLSAVLDVEDVIDHAYTLEVSSPGLDRPLREAADFRRFAGRLAKIVVAPPVDGQGHLTGRLKGLDGETVLLADSKERIHRIPLSQISRARLAVEF